MKKWITISVFSHNFVHLLFYYDFAISYQFCKNMTDLNISDLYVE